MAIRNSDEISPELVERIAKEAAKMALEQFTEEHADAILLKVEERFYSRVGQAGIQTVLKWAGMAFVAIALWAVGNGYIKPGG